MEYMTMDINERYLRGVGDFLGKIELASEDYLAVLTLQGRLAQAISEIRQYGPTSSARAEIARVTTELDRLCLAHLEMPFRSLCGIDELPAASPPKTHHNLPQPDYGRFVGREAELAQVIRILQPYPYSQEHLVTIDGIGGIGKSALALEVAHYYLRGATKLPESERFDAIVWTSAKQRTLTAEGIVRRKQALRTLDDIYTTISITLGRQDITRARLEEQREIVRKVLTQQRVLLIVDNLETIDDETMMTFLRELPAPTKAIVTTRHRLDVAYPIRLVGMPLNDAKELVDQECEKKNVILADDQVHKLYNRTGGVPLALVWSVAQMGFGYGVDAVLTRLGNPSGDIAHFCFEGAMEHTRGTDAHKLLMALALFATDASRETLGHVAGFGKDTLSRDEGLVALETLSLVNKQGDRFALLPLTRSYGLYELEANSDFAHKATERWVAQLTGLLQSQTDRYWIENQAIIMQEGENFRSLLDWAMARDDKNTVLKVIKPSVLYLAYVARRAEALELALEGKEITRRYGDEKTNAWLCIKSGWILSQQESHEKAIEQIEEGIKKYERSIDNKGVCFAKCFLAQALRHGGRLSKVEELLAEVVDKAENLGYHEGVSIAEFEFGKLARKKNEWERAYEHFSNADSALLRFGEKSTDIFSLTILAIRGNRGTAALKLSKYAEASEISRQVLDVLEDERWRHLGVARNFKARMHLQAAEAEAFVENYPEAKKQAERALALYTSTENKKGIEQAQQVLERLRDRKAND
jgi:LuxR family glucitol operon transcriptional activator